MDEADEVREPGRQGNGLGGEPTDEQVGARIEELLRGSDPHDPAVRAELDRLWQVLRARDAGPEVDRLQADG